ncbi:hypothetical protein [Longispora urticae]
MDTPAGDLTPALLDAAQWTDGMLADAGIPVCDVPFVSVGRASRVPQIPRTQRIRSDSSSRPDNIRGFPSYALSEAWRDRSLKHLAQVPTEPVVSDYRTPRAGTVFAGPERESARIGYPSMLVKGAVRMVRRRVLHDSS